MFKGVREAEARSLLFLQKCSLFTGFAYYSLEIEFFIGIAQLTWLSRLRKDISAIVPVWYVGTIAVISFNLLVIKCVQSE